ncbi:MAG: histidine--tRNA ligase [Melioribacteraceae bacterium]|nr:histidine--tRNA ligase [Melioribacteraceae bacterium]
MIKAITGTNDILSEDSFRWRELEKLVNGIMSFYNYKEIRTPIFEETSLFSRGIGDATDIVSKEMYSFIDRSGVSLTLKPEMTASVARAFIEHSLDKKQSLNKLYYISPMFRQERPQAGRFRQFHQFGAEVLGSQSPLLDAEMIIIAYDIFAKLGLTNLKVKINSLGVTESREIYKAKLKEYLNPHFNNLSEESRKRFDINILRIFDSKDDRDQSIMKDAPLLIEYLDDASLQHFNTVKKVLENSNVPFEVDPKLVRGLDYYCHTTFEIVSGSVGSQSALCGGGRYDGLIEQLGGKPVPGVGFAAGIERLLLACKNENVFEIKEEPLDVYMILLDSELRNDTFKAMLELRRNGLRVDSDYLMRSIKAQMREANKYNSRFTLFIGGDEYKSGDYLLKDMSEGNQFLFKTSDMQGLIKKIRE